MAAGRGISRIRRRLLSRAELAALALALCASAAGAVAAAGQPWLGATPMLLAPALFLAALVGIARTTTA